MRRVNSLKQKVQAGTPVVGIWVSLPSPSVAELASHAGYDFIIIDSEHGQMGFETIINMVRACETGPAEPMVRVPSKDPDFLKRLLDSGVSSYMIPMVDTAEQATSIVSACRYPPHGIRGYAATSVRASRYGLDEDYVSWAGEELFLCLQMESREAAKNSEAIAAIDGVDMLFIGANDLSGSLSLLEQTAHPDVLATMETIKASAAKHGKPLGTIPRPGTPTAELAKEGFILGAGGHDMFFIREAALADIKAFRDANNQS